MTLLRWHNTGFVTIIALNILTSDQRSTITGLVDLQKPSLLSLVNTRKAVSVELRKFMAGQTADSATVMNLSASYGADDGEIIYLLASRFSEVFHSMSAEQKAKTEALALEPGYMDPSGAFLYSAPIPMPLV